MLEARTAHQSIAYEHGRVQRAVLHVALRDDDLLEEELSDVILEKMRARDASSFANLNFDRFCCSLFFFAEMVSACLTRELEAGRSG